MVAARAVLEDVRSTLQMRLDELIMSGIVSGVRTENTLRPIFDLTLTPYSP